MKISHSAEIFKLRLGASRSRSVGLSVFQTRFQTSCPNRVSKQALHSVSKQNTRKNLLYFVWKLCKACLETLFGISQQQTSICTYRQRTCNGLVSGTAALYYPSFRFFQKGPLVYPTPIHVCVTKLLPIKLTELFSSNI